MNKWRSMAAGVFPLLVLSFLFFAPNIWAWVPPCAIDGSCRVMEGRMTGGGSIFLGTQEDGDFFAPPGTRLTHGFELHCDIADKPNNLQVDVHMPNGDEGTFHLDTVVSSYCWINHSIDAGHPSAPFNSLFGEGTGRYKGEAGWCSNWEFNDAGEPGTNDQIVEFRVWKPFTAGNCSDGTFVFSTTAGHKLTFGNHQAHKDNK